MTVGVLLLNLGTPRSLAIKDIRAYLREFLSDPYVISLPWLWRFILVNFIIVPFRAKKTARAYQEIWQTASPLLLYSKEFSKALATQLGDDCHVALGMRYASPSIASALAELVSKQCEKIIVFPLFPQYSSAATESALAKTRALLLKNNPHISYTMIRYFYDDAAYLRALANSIGQAQQEFHPDMILFSYHGLPQQQLSHTTCCATHNQSETSCLQQHPDLVECYRAQCFYTTEALADLLKLDRTQYQTVFQSRLGAAAWIKPYLDDALPLLAAQGVRRLMLVCPSFVVDCLETLEEIGIRARQQWSDLGGVAFYLTPCLNAKADWVEAAASLIQRFSHAEPT